MITTDTFSELFPKEQDVKGIQLTSQQCQFLTNILRQENLEDLALTLKLIKSAPSLRMKSPILSILQQVSFSLHYLLYKNLGLLILVPRIMFVTI